MNNQFHNRIDHIRIIQNTSSEVKALHMDRTENPAETRVCCQTSSFLVFLIGRQNGRIQSTCHVFSNVAESQFGNIWNAGVLHMECERRRLLQDKVSATCGMVDF